MTKMIGILGGGQLGRMLTEAAKKLGLETIVLDPTLNCPASKVGARQIVGSFQDPLKIHELADVVDVITVEIEHVNVAALEEIERLGKAIYPSAKSIRIIQDKYEQKFFLREKGIKVADFAQVHDETQLAALLKLYEGKGVLKSRLGGYDGKGNFFVTSADQFDQARREFEKRAMYLERVVDITSPGTYELSVIGVRSSMGQIRLYDPSFNIHRNGILHMSVTPAPIPPEIEQSAYDLARKVITAFDTVGVFAVEMFYDGAQLYVNEVAPRVHNSGHQTIYTATTSQFENHMRAVAGMELGDTAFVQPAIMCNILGPAGWSGAYQINASHLGDSAHLCDYGKGESRAGRKLGHVTFSGIQDRDEAPRLLSTITVEKV